MELADHDDDEDEEEHVAAPLPFSVQFKLLEQQNRTRLSMARQEQDSQQAPAEARPDSPEARDSTPIMDAFRNDHSELGLTAPPGPAAPPVDPEPATTLPTDAEAPRLSDMFFTSNGVFSEPYNRAYLDSMETLPPRPAAPRPMWPTMLDYASPFSPRKSKSLSLTYTFPGSNFSLAANAPNFPAAYSPDFVGNFSGRVEPLLSNPYAAPQPFSSVAENPWEQSKSFAAVPTSGVQTPPPAPSSEFSSPPVRRTEVSIREIVEDVSQQPPTPTSVTGGLKRKAEVLDEAVEGLEQEPAPAPQTPAGVATPDATVVLADNAVDQRPKKRPRSRLASFAKYLVSGVAGAAGAVALLTSVPNDFYVP